MKILCVKEAEGQLKELFYEALRGETIVIKDGDKYVTLIPEKQESNRNISSPMLRPHL